MCLDTKSLLYIVPHIVAFFIGWAIGGWLWHRGC